MLIKSRLVVQKKTPDRISDFINNSSVPYPSCYDLFPALQHHRSGRQREAGPTCLPTGIKNTCTSSNYDWQLSLLVPIIFPFGLTEFTGTYRKEIRACPIH